MEALSGYFLPALILLTVAANWGLKKVSPKGNRFPTCRTCNLTCTRRSLDEATFPLPEKITTYLEAYDLPTSIVSRYVCPGGHVMIWYAPRAGDADKGAFAAKRL